MAKEDVRVPANVLVHGKQNPVSKDEKGNISIEETDPLGPIKHSPFTELLPATEAWVKKYGGSDVSIVAFNVAVILKLIPKDELKETDSASDKDTDHGKRKPEDQEPEGPGETEPGGD